LAPAEERPGAPAVAKPKNVAMYLKDIGAGDLFAAPEAGEERYDPDVLSSSNTA
jgi:hypothetical protein